MRLTYFVRHIIIGAMLLSATTAHTVVARSPEQKITHRITAELRPALNMPTHGFYRGYNDMGKAVPYAGSAHLKYSFSLGPDCYSRQLYPTAYQGIGVAAQSFFNHDLVGAPIMIYIFQGSRIADIGNRLSFGYEWNLGASYGWKINKVVGSKCNIYINVGLPFTLDINQRWELSVGPEYTHFSNGDTTFPNGGANTVGMRLGVTWKSKPGSDDAPGKLLIQREDNLRTMKFAERVSYDLFMYGAWRADRYINEGRLHIINEPHAVAGMTFNPLYRLNRYFCVGPSLDIMLDRSADLNCENIKLPATHQTSCGISTRAELTMPYFSINIGAGYNILTIADDLEGFYTTYNLKAFLSQKVFLAIGYRLGTVNYAHNLMFGVGLRL